MAELWNNIIYESSLIEKVLEYYEKKNKEKREKGTKDIIDEIGQKDAIKK